MNSLTSYPKDKINILLLENISKNAVQQFEDAGYYNIKHHSTALSEDILLDAVNNIHLLGIRSKTQLTEKVIKAGNKLLAAGCYCIGTNQVHLPSAVDQGVAVFNAPYSNTRSVAELVVGAAIMLLRRIPEKNKAAHAGIWLKDAAGSFELRGKILGIIGYGNIGIQVSVLAESLGMQVIYYDVEPKLPIGNAKPMRTMQELLSTANIISLHIPETINTKLLLGENEFSMMQNGSILINYARGNVIDHNALYNAIKNNNIAGAAIDVFPDEPEKTGLGFKSILQNVENVMLTPHIGGSTEEAQQSIGEDVTNKLLNFLEKGITTGSFTVPALNLPITPHTHRILHIHKNIPGIISEITQKLSAENINIIGQYLKTNEQIGYVVLDVDKKMSNDAFKLIDKVKGTIKSRMLW